MKLAWNRARAQYPIAAELVAAWLLLRATRSFVHESEICSRWRCVSDVRTAHSLRWLLPNEGSECPRGASGRGRSSRAEGRHAPAGCSQRGPEGAAQPAARLAERPLRPQWHRLGVARGPVGAASRTQ